MNSTHLEQKLLCQNHQKPVLFMSTDVQLPITERLLCCDCFQISAQVAKCITMEEANQLVAESTQYLEFSSAATLKQLNQFTENLSEAKAKIIKNIEEIKKMVELWIKDISIIIKPNSNNLIGNIDFLLCNMFEQEMRNKQHLSQINQVFQQLFVVKNYEDCLDQLNNSINQIYKRREQQLILNVCDSEIKSVNLINTVKQEELSNAIAFNNKGSIMAAGQGNDIQIWAFDKGKIIQMQRLKGHTNILRCLAFSKQQNWFASGSSDCTIRCWKEEATKNWESTQPEKQHISMIYCIILDNSEEQLISCSADKTIKAWKVDRRTNILEYDYTFENRHTNFIICISFNESETQLVSCGFDKKIILWKQEQKKQWIYINDIQMEDYGKRICFISESFIAWQQYKKGITHILECKNGKITKRSDLNIDLDLENDQFEDTALFPTIVNKNKKIIIQKHNQYVYILKKEYDGKLKILSQPIYCSHESNYGALTFDGEYLIIWNEGTREFRIYNIKYL